MRSGLSNFVAHITKKSGGIIPRNDFRNKKDGKHKHVRKTLGNKFKNGIKIYEILAGQRSRYHNQ